MANWCNNIISFSGKQKNMENLQKLFEQMAEKESETNEGQLPPLVDGETDYLFDIRWEDGVLYCDTKWSPNIEMMQTIADKYLVDFIYTYSEMAMGIYGEAQYLNRGLADICLESADFAQYSYHEETDSYFFEGDDYDSDDEILEILLERKKAIATL